MTEPRLMSLDTAAARRPVMRPSDIRKAVAEWASQGFAVVVEPDGTIRVTPPVSGAGDAFDMVDMRR